MRGDFDLVVRGGTVIDGTGSGPKEADVGVIGTRIAEVDRNLGRGTSEIDARGRYVVPGFVDIHTHYDAQLLWEQRALPSSEHGVTTIVTGNCGVGVAPCAPAGRDRVIGLLEQIEEVPRRLLSEHLDWDWRTFVDYMQRLERRRFDVDVAVQVPHSPLRLFAMGPRGADGDEQPTEAELETMRSLVAESIRAGAIGVSTSRSVDHRSADGALAPCVTAPTSELVAMAAVLGDLDRGVFQMILNPEGDPAESFAIVREVAKASRRPVSFTLLQSSRKPDAWRVYLEEIEGANRSGLRVRGQVLPRPVGLLYGLDLSLHPFAFHPSYQPIAALPLPERVEIMRNPAFRARLLSESPRSDLPRATPFMLRSISLFASMYPMGTQPDYEPSAESSVEALARSRGVPAEELAYDLLLEDDGKAILYAPGSNFLGNSTAIVGRLLAHPQTVVALGDGGAHYTSVCDASYSTYLLTRWIKQGSTEGFTLPWAIRSLTTEPSEAVGLTDRGTLQPGKKADMNVLDLGQLSLGRPRVVRDLPGGGPRLRQSADGYGATIVSGKLTYQDGQAASPLPGRLVRATA